MKVLEVINKIGLMLTMYVSLPILIIIALFYVFYLYNLKRN